MVTLEGWTGIMYNLQDASQPWLAVLFCILVVVIGSFFLLNVILAVIMDAFQDVDKLQKVMEEKREKDYRETLRLYNIKDPDLSDDEDERSHDSERASSLAKNEAEADEAGRADV